MNVYIIRTRLGNVCTSALNPTSCGIKLYNFKNNLIAFPFSKLS